MFRPWLVDGSVLRLPKATGGWGFVQSNYAERLGNGAKPGATPYSNAYKQDSSSLYCFYSIVRAMINSCTI